MPEPRPQKYREWLDNRFNEDLDDEPEWDESEEEPERDDGFPLHDDYDEESSP